MNSIKNRGRTERGMNMKRTHLIAVLVGIVAMGIFAADASAMYHPGMGRFMQRDPGPGSAIRIGARGGAPVRGFIPMDQYADGMNLYQYARSSPGTASDPTGLRVSPSAIVVDIGGDLRDMLYGVETEAQRKYGGVLNTQQGTTLLLRDLGNYFDPMNKKGTNRFVFTCKYGWIDLGHFFLTAWWSMNGGDAMTGYRGGQLVELFQDVRGALGHHDSATSRWSPEDLPSDAHGAVLGADLYAVTRDISAMGRNSQHWPSWGSSRAPVAVKVLWWLTYDAQVVDKDFFQPWRGNWVRQVLEQDASDPRWVDARGELTGEARSAGRTYAGALAFQRQGKAFQCFCNENGTRKREVAGARNLCPCGIDVSSEKRPFGSW